MTESSVLRDAAPIGFVQLDSGETPSLYWRAASDVTEGSSSDRVESGSSSDIEGTAGIGAVLFEGDVASLADLLEHNRVQLAIIGQLPAPESERVVSETESGFVDRVIRQVSASLDAAESVLAQSERRLEDLVSPDELAGQMASVIPVPSPWDELVGPFLSRDAVTNILSVSVPDLLAMSEAGQVLSVDTADGMTLYPSFQFTTSGEVAIGLSAVLGEFGETLRDGWAVAAWLRSRSTLLGKRPSDFILEETDLTPVLTIASDMAARWRQ